MKFVMIKEYSWNLSKDKIILDEVQEHYTTTYLDNNETEEHIMKHKVTLAYLLKMGSFNEDKDYNILVNTDSVQIRPKAIYKNEKGYYKKDDRGRRQYFKGQDEIDIINAINKFKHYLSTNKKLNLDYTEYKEIEN